MASTGQTIRKIATPPIRVSAKRHHGPTTVPIRHTLDKTFSAKSPQRQAHPPMAEREKSQHKKRQRIYVDQHVQGGIVVRLVALWVASTAVAVAVWFVMQFFADPTQGLAFYLAGAGKTLFPLLLAFGVTLPIAILQLLRFTHRFAGPVVRLRRMMHELANGDDVPTLKFRPNDYWQDLADEYNRAATALKESRARIAALEKQLEQQEMTASV